MSNIIFRETIPLRASVAQVREFIMTPARILDYYPSGIEGEVLEPGRSFYCRGKSGVSLLERVEEDCSDTRLTLRVTTAIGLKNPPFTAEKITRARSFTMVEDWELEATDEGCLLTKTWRDLKKYRQRYLPMRLIVKRSAMGETRHLQEAWDRAAT